MRLAHLQAVVGRVLIQIDQTIVSIAAAAGLLQEQGLQGVMVVITSQRITNRNRDDVSPDDIKGDK